MRRILIVDDEPSVLDILAALLTDEGHSVQTAPNGRVTPFDIDTLPGSAERVVGSRSR